MQREVTFFVKTSEFIAAYRSKVLQAFTSMIERGHYAAEPQRYYLGLPQDENGERDRVLLQGDGDQVSFRVRREAVVAEALTQSLNTTVIPANVIDVEEQENGYRVTVRADVSQVVVDMEWTPEQLVDTYDYRNDPWGSFSAPM